MMQWMRLSGVVFGGFFCLSLPAKAQMIDPDGDQDGVSDYDDYCPSTPAGTPVWTRDRVLETGGQPRWVGCGGGTDTAAPGYKPPIRPSIGYAQSSQMFDAAGDFNVAEHVGWYSGRCWKETMENPISSILVVKEDMSAGPAFPSVFTLIPYIRTATGTPDFYDHISFNERLDLQRDIDRSLTRPAVKLEVGYGVPPQDPNAAIAVEVRRNAETGYFNIRRQSGNDGNYACYYFKKVN